MTDFEKTLEECFGNYKVETFNVEDKGYFSNFLDSNSLPKGSGLRISKEESINVSISEAIERFAFHKSFYNKTHLTQQHPSTCGFAAGINPTKVKIRSQFEAFERWAISQWIDFNKFIPQVTPNNISPLAKRFSNDFDKVLRFEKIFYNIPLVELTLDIKIGISVAIKGDGIYMGSRVSLPFDDSWDHSICECWAAKKHCKSITESNFIIDNRIKFFSKNKDVGLQQITTDPYNNDWPAFRIKYHSEISECPLPFICYRTIAHDYIDWISGEINRFVY